MDCSRLKPDYIGEATSPYWYRRQEEAWSGQCASVRTAVRPTGKTKPGTVVPGHGGGDGVSCEAPLLGQGQTHNITEIFQWREEERSVDTLGEKQKADKLYECDMKAGIVELLYLSFRCIFRYGVTIERVLSITEFAFWHYLIKDIQCAGPSTRQTCWLSETNYIWNETVIYCISETDWFSASVKI